MWKRYSTDDKTSDRRIYIRFFLVKKRKKKKKSNPCDLIKKINVYDIILSYFHLEQPFSQFNKKEQNRGIEMNKFFRFDPEESWSKIFKKLAKRIYPPRRKLVQNFSRFLLAGCSSKMQRGFVRFDEHPCARNPLEVLSPSATNA